MCVIRKRPVQAKVTQSEPWGFLESGEDREHFVQGEQEGHAGRNTGKPVRLQQSEQEGAS